MARSNLWRPNPDRAIYVEGEIGEELISRLTPEIIRLRKELDPITVYINSPGGSVKYANALLSILNARSQDFESFHIITCATQMAASAAADILSAGNYSAAFPGSQILYHGGRYRGREITAESGLDVAHNLRIGNQWAAMDLAKQIEFRILLRFATVGKQSRDSGKSVPPEFDTPLGRYTTYITPFLSETAQRLMIDALERHERYEELVSTVEAATKSISATATPLEVEAAHIKAIVDFEVKNAGSDPALSFRDGRVNQLVSDFLLYQEFTSLSQGESLRRWCPKYGPFFAEPAVTNRILLEMDETKRNEMWFEELNGQLRPVWTFYIALCFILQRGENDFLTAQDAYWLGLIDEVIGETDMCAFRLILESDDSPEPTQADSETSSFSPVAASE